MEKCSISYICGGVAQYATFNFKEGKINRHDFRPKWLHGKIVPELANNTFEEALVNLKEFHPSVMSVDGIPIYFTKNEISYDISEEVEKASKIVDEVVFNFFKSTIQPIMEKFNIKIANSWVGHKVLIKKELGEWVNVHSRDIEYKIIDNLSDRFMKEVLGIKIEMGHNGEAGYISSSHGIGVLLSYIDMAKIPSFFVEL